MAKKPRKIIAENWNAIREIEAAVAEQTKDPKAGFNAGTVFFGVEKQYLMLNCKYRALKGPKNNQTFTNSYKDMGVFAEFCPFTGKPLYEDDESTES